ncbi:Hypothetical protein SCF082_LOCUS2880 [Durusdinium trenchii]|uniref:Uncharacterized protein n=1 Tax=Durusdinium trenchii TaxID=1381693 RepID=A0ABP0HP03_9DINO
MPRYLRDIIVLAICLLDVCGITAAEPFWSPLLWPEVRAGCRSSAAAHSEQTNSSDELPHVRPFRSHEFLHGESPKSWLRGAYALVKKLRNCTTVRSCAFSWSFLALIFGARKGGPFESEGRRAVWENLWTDATQRMIHLRQAELLRAKATRLLSPFGGPQERKVPDEGSSVLLLSAHSAGYFQEPFVAPFVRQLECYAFARGMQFAADGGPWPLRHVPLGRTGHYFWVGHWHSTKIGADGAVEQEKWEEDHLKYVVTLVEDLQQYQLSRAVELASLENFVTIYFDDPGKQTKIWSIERQLDKHVMMVLYLDVDVTIRPDSLQWGLIPFLVPQSHSHRPGDVFVRDSWPVIECLNSGFLALRNTRASRLLLELWRQKTRWAASWDQSALAESILELVGMEMQLLGKRGYNSECLRFLLPLPNGVFPYGMYCDCWQSVLSDMIGPHRKRRSRIVTFVDPERIDVNFVPNDFFYAHGFDLAEMHLVSRANASTMNPLIVHWAGTGKHRLWLAREYLQERFNVSLDASCKELSAVAGAVALAGVASTAGPFNSDARAARCCRRLKKVQEKGKQVTLEDMVFWGCCDWRPVRPQECVQWVDAMDSLDTG